jgi:cyclic pyranopterin phosphate synthase
MTFGEAGSADRLTHVDEHGKAHMVDVTGKEVTVRVAEARCLVRTTADMVRSATDPSTGMDLMETARVAGIMAAKQTASLVPLCHPIRIEGIEIDVEVGDGGVHIRAVSAIVDRTGVEIEALTACTVAALVVIQPLLAVDDTASIENLTVWHKSGGRSGTWSRSDDGGVRPAADGI